MVYNDAPWLDHGQEHRFVHPKLSHEVSTDADVPWAWGSSRHAALKQALQCQQARLCHACSSAAPLSLHAAACHAAYKTWPAWTMVL